MRNAAARKNRSIIYRVLSILFILLGITKGISTYLHRDGIPMITFLSAMETAVIWLAIAAVWVALSRVWGELAEEASDKE